MQVFIRLQHDLHYEHTVLTGVYTFKLIPDQFWNPFTVSCFINVSSRVFSGFPSLVTEDMYYNTY